MSDELIREVELALLRTELRSFGDKIALQQCLKTSNMALEKALAYFKSQDGVNSRERIASLEGMLQTAIGMHDLHRVEEEGIDPPRQVEAWTVAARKLLAKHTGEGNERD